MSETVLRVVIAVLTYQRLAEVRDLLPLLAAQAARTTMDVQILVVDNDPSGSAEAVVQEAKVARYVHEPKPGIVAGRNRALDESAGSDLIIFIDDDEQPVDTWLESMLDAYLVDRPAGVVGPVISRFSVQPEQWILDGGFFDRPRLPTGSRVPAAATNNLLLDLHIVRRLNLAFDEAFGMTGGSDTLFTRQLVERGGALVWCDEAVVHDIVPAGRITRGWVLQRYFRMGNSWSRSTVLLATSHWTRSLARCRMFSAGAGRAAVGAARWGAGAVFRRRRDAARGLRLYYRGLGMASGAWGHVYAEYTRADARRERADATARS